MRSLCLIITGYLFMSCVPPQIISNPAPKIAKSKGIIVACEFKTGEVFEFADPGASVVSKGHVVFGRLESGDFTTYEKHQIAYLYTPEKTTWSDVDTTAKVTSIELTDGFRVYFDNEGARIYSAGPCIVGSTLNGSRVVLPLPLVTQTANLTNLKEIKRGNTIGTFFLLAGTVAVLWLYVQFKLQQRE
ncbi:MAG TPA: hypothetical protein PLG25_12870, partial [bacterium]|nr:hypothetical protein [bacterium]